MSASDEIARAGQNLLFDSEDLASDIEAILGGDPHAPEIMARLFLGFRQGIESGLEGIRQASDTLLAAIGVIYLHSGAHAAALKLYVLSQEGELKFEDEPLNLINAAIGRSTAQPRGRHKPKRI
jgi:hypothetical protein